MASKGGIESLLIIVPTTTELQAALALRKRINVL